MLQQLQPRSSNPHVSTSCSECQGLLHGTRTNDEPHEYLLFSSRESATADVTSYRCLLCNSELIRHRGTFGSRWA
jgi:hypothetical protein